ncbi:hypothetical protein ACFSJU_00675 [Paradesertivirga mongoliensis]|uniref:Outer membrane protein beta-barrel domain-containing protein n=1 Tax=Paradesertivirga mongoliensis TaxID=2100740 RepID=A0ABW4ZFT1_9SPHI|nr:hypothetical protein [Pedobacter mongoliensis]
MNTLKIIYISFLYFFLVNDAAGQIVINGRSPVRYSSAGHKNSLSISYGNIFWVDGKNVPLSGSSYSLRSSYNPGFEDNTNHSMGITVGYERTVARRFTLRTAFSRSKLATGMRNRADLITTDRSRITQLALYSQYSLTRNINRRFQFQWLAGPELIYVKKDVLVHDYVDGEGDPKHYRQNIAILEGGIVSGLGASFQISDSFCLFSNAMVGVSLPGRGFTATSSGLGLKYMW